MEVVQPTSQQMAMATIGLFRQNPLTLFAQCPKKYLYGVITIIALLIAAHWEHPNGFLPTLNEIAGALVATICVGLLICVAITIEEYFETATWPWQHDGPVKKWRAWFWGALDDELDTPSPVPQAHDVELAEKVHPSFMGLRQDVQFAADQDLNSPSTNLLLRGLRPAADDPPTPTHKSGLLGESPMTHKFKHFSGDGFHKRSEARNAAARYSGLKADFMAVKNALSELKEEADEDHEKYMNMDLYCA